MGFNGSIYQYLIIFQKGQLVCTTTYEEKTSRSENIYFYEAEISSRWAWNISWKLSTLLLVTKFYLFAESFYYKRKYVTLRISEMRDIFSPIEKGVSSLSLSVYGVILVRIFLHLDWIRRSISPYSVRMRENVDHNISEYWHFTQCMPSHNE